MAELDGCHDLVRPKTPTTPNAQHILQADSPSGWSPTFGKSHDLEEDHFPRGKKLSVIAKVKEKAKKWRQSFLRRRHGDQTPSWGVALDDDEVDEDPEYLGAPMYESEHAPEGYKENARQHPRADPVISEKHVLANTVKSHADQEKEKPLTPAEKTMAEDENGKPPSPPAKKTTADDRKVKPPAVKKTVDDEDQKGRPPSPPKKTVTKDEKEKLDSTNEKSVTEEETGRQPNSMSTAVGKERHASSEKPITEEGKGKLPSSGKSMADGEKENPSSSNKSTAEDVEVKVPNSEKALTETVTEKLAPAYATISEATHTITSKLQGLTVSILPGESAREDAMTEEQNWDMGVSVKEYIRNKLEPGEDEKALSQVISDAISSKKTPEDKGVMEKVKEAMASLLQKEEPAAQASPLRTSNSSKHIPVSTTAHEVEEESQRRRLQAN
ncbi:hypothetical protein Ancab_007327 [Ancistrocladus abbreviatus]